LKKYLLDALIEYQNTNTYPFHMPGHKRQGQFVNPFTIDITEIDGFDNLYHEEGILKEAQERAAALYRSSETHFLVNGSTGGILSAISSCTRTGGKLLMARNCHKAVYHAALLGELEVVYLYPEKESNYNINGEISAAEVERILAEEQDILAVFLTSPTYDGVVSDIKAIAKIAHQYQIPLIVDEAHGAHLSFHSYFPENAIGGGADIVINSLHKTMPAFTQTALLHVNGELVDRERLSMYLSIYQTSSPSYLLMAGIDECIRKITREKETLFADFVKRLDRFYQEAEQWNKIKLVADLPCFDRSKLILSVKDTTINGLILKNKLREKYAIELEMAAGSYALALTSVMDTDEGFERLLQGVTEIDKSLQDIGLDTTKSEFGIVSQMEKNKCACRISEAVSGHGESRLLKQSIGEISTEFLYLYPPGIPLLVPGEVISESLVAQIETYREQGFSLQGLADYQINEVKCLSKVR